MTNPKTLPHCADLLLALEKIANPIKHLRDEAEKEGGKLDGRMANAIADDPAFYRGIAKDAIAAWNRRAGEGE